MVMSSDTSAREILYEVCSPCNTKQQQPLTDRDRWKDYLTRKRSQRSNSKYRVQTTERRHRSQCSDAAVKCSLSCSCPQSHCTKHIAPAPPAVGTVLYCAPRCCMRSGRRSPLIDWLQSASTLTTPDRYSWHLGNTGTLTSLCHFHFFHCLSTCLGVLN